MPTGVSVASGFGGFAKGFASALAEGRRVQREEEHRAEDRKLKEFGTIFPLIFDEAQQTGDYTRANEIIGEYMPNVGKTMKKRGVDLASIAPMLAPATPQTSGQNAATSKTFTDLSTQQMEAGGPPILPSRAAVAPGTPPPPPDERSMFIGQPMTTPTQKIEGKTAAARRFAKSNPDVPLMSAFKMFGLDVPTTAQLRPQSVPGELSDGTPAFGVFDPATKQYLDPDTQQPIPDFRPRTSTGSRTLGADREALAKQLFGKSASQLDADQMAQVNAKLPEFAQSMAFGRGMGTGRASIQTELDKPIGTTAAQIYNVAPTTTMRQLQGTIALRPEQQEQIRSLGQVDSLLGEIEQGLPLVFPDVEPGIWGRLQTQFSLGAQKLGADEDLAALDGAINAALAQVAQLSGQPGSRLSDRDVELARATLAEIHPKLFGGDTLATAQSRLGVLRRLLEKAKSGLPPRTAAPAAGAPAGTPSPGPAGAASPAGAPAGGGTGFFMDAQGNILNGPNGQIVIPAH